MSGKKYLIVMAAGHGTRMGGNLPKQFMQQLSLLQRCLLPILKQLIILGGQFIIKCLHNIHADDFPSD